jgi:hypothetical protein
MRQRLGQAHQQQASRGGYRQLPVGHHITRNLPEHIALIKRQKDRSLQDPETRQLAVRLVSGNYDYTRHPRTGRLVPAVRAWGRWYYAPDAEKGCEARDDECEIQRIWDFVVLNFRYTYDPRKIDFFATAQASLEAGGGDCDDATILIDALAESIGFATYARVIAPGDAPNEWQHVYPMLGVCTKDRPTRYVPLDMTVKGATPGWQYPDIARHADFEL